jgi:hypothetical protein
MMVRYFGRENAGVGEYFWDSLIADIESLNIYAGVHKKKYGLHQMFAKRFPYTIYYEIVEDIAYIIAVLPMRREPVWIKSQIEPRS